MTPSYYRLMVHKVGVARLFQQTKKNTDIVFNIIIHVKQILFKL